MVPGSMVTRGKVYPLVGQPPRIGCVQSESLCTRDKPCYDRVRSYLHTRNTSVSIPTLEHRLLKCLEAYGAFEDAWALHGAVVYAYANACASTSRTHESGFFAIEPTRSRLVCAMLHHN